MHNRRKTKIITILLAVLMACFFAGCGQSGGQQDEETAAQTQKTVIQETDISEESIDRDGSYDSRDDVALYLYTYGELPGNYITKEEARSLGWQGGSVERYAPGKCIGGNYYGNYEGNLPKGEYHECDIDTLGSNDRGAKRIVYSDDAIYYTSDHYNTFVQLYDKDGKL